MIPDSTWQAFRVLATDIDGTLVSADGTIGEATRRELAAAVRRGVRLVFVTGRPARWMAPIVAQTGHTGTAVCSNGAVFVDMHEERILTTQALDPAVVGEVAETLSGVLGPDARFAAEHAEPGPITRSQLIFQEGFLPPGIPGTPTAVADLLTRPGAVKLMARAPGDHAENERLTNAAMDRVGHLGTVTHSSRSHRLLEVGPPGVTKASGLAELVSSWGLGPEQVVAVGDMPNDIPMLRWAGGALAVGSAHEEVLRVAGDVVPDPEHDGIAQIARRLLR